MSLGRLRRKRAFNDTLCGSESFEMKSMVTDTTYVVDYDWHSDGS